MHKSLVVVLGALALISSSCDRGGEPSAADKPAEPAPASATPEPTPAGPPEAAGEPDAPVVAKSVAAAAELAQASATANPGWVAYDSPEGRFKVELPQQPERSTVPVPTLAGNLELETYVAMLGTSAFMVMTVDYPKEIVSADKVDAMLDGARDGALANVKGTLISETKLEIDGFPARRLQINGVNSGITVTVHAILCLVDNRLFQVLASSVDSVDPATLERYFASFHPRKA